MSQVKKCSRCGWKFEQAEGNWFSRHKGNAVFGVLALLFVVALPSGDLSDPNTVASSKPSASPSPSPTPKVASPSAEASPSSSSPVVERQQECVDYPAEMARTLVTNDTGKQRAPGAIGKAVSVLSPAAGFRDRPVYVIAIDLGGTPVLLAHPVTDTPPKPTGSGLYGSLDDFSEKATNFPQGTPAAEGAAGFAAETARDCVS